jgi:nitrogen fixation NifU-like protein
MTPLAALYQELILEHSRQPRHFGPLPGASHRAARDNPFCGDAIAVSLRLAGDQIEAATFEGAGCAIALASASLMTEAVAGRTAAEAEALADRFSRFVSGATAAVALGDLEAFAAVAQFPARVECARLPWHALLAALGSGVRSG